MPRRPGGYHRLRTRLDDIELAIGTVLRPFDIHGPVLPGEAGIVILDTDRIVGQLQHLGVAQAVASLFVGRGVDIGRAPAAPSP